MAAGQELTGVFLHDGSHEGKWRRDDRGDMALDNLDRSPSPNCSRT
jgi:hypothetical protein